MKEKRIMTLRQKNGQIKIETKPVQTEKKNSQKITPNNQKYSRLNFQNLFGSGQNVDIISRVDNEITDLNVNYYKPIINLNSLKINGFNLNFFKKNQKITNCESLIRSKGLAILFSKPAGFKNISERNNLFYLKDKGKKGEIRQTFSYNLEKRSLTRNSYIPEYSDLKSSVKYQFSKNSRDGDAFPLKGYLIDSHTEFSGLFKMPTFIKTIAHISYHFPAFKQMSLGILGSTGIIHPFKSNTGLVGIFDRFYQKQERKNANQLLNIFFKKNPNRNFKKIKHYQIKDVEMDSEIIKRNNLGGDVFGKLQIEIVRKDIFNYAKNIFLGSRVFINSQFFGLTNPEYYSFSDNINQFINNRETNVGIGFSFNTPLKQYNINCHLPFKLVSKSDVFKHFKFSFNINFH
ncbi:sorting and assembly machinery component 50 [Anaeramoeba flamelloides]|uniref:Sorting and assembly machinery component 50 n=1 Tax=Anaeramoeba flamelloides TaxID=1746091 RepID=A0ABQ8XWT5_9EUKA|nr:sorting and assembly machinery component 50 [Anaeramoeba flamelloides]